MAKYNDIDMQNWRDYSEIITDSLWLIDRRDNSGAHTADYHGNFIPGNLERNAVFVSRNHAARYGSTSFVYNGLDWDDYGPVDFRTPRKDFHFLGKAAWSVKNVKGAIDVVKALPGEHIHILGGEILPWE